MIDEKAFPLVNSDEAGQSPVPDDVREIAELRATLAMTPGDWATHYSLGMRLRQHMQIEEACHHLAQAAAQVPDNSPNAAAVHGGLAISLLQLGNFALGWPEYEWRFRGPMADHIALFDKLAPRWNGSSTPRELLLFHYEQGLGDTINFCRYLKYPILQGARAVVFCQPPLRRLLSQSYGNFIHVLPEDRLPQVSRQASLLSMPYIMLPQIGTRIPSEVPYLSASDEDVARMRPRIDAHASGRPRFGLAWRGNPDNPTDKLRSIPAKNLRAVLSLDADFFAIQPDADIKELQDLGFTNVYSLAGDIRDFADTAAALTILDGLVSVDTSVVHLAGALNRPAWVLLAWPSDWRWGLGSSTTAWYPSMRLFRCPPGQDWTGAVADLVTDLSQSLESASGAA